jgi:hypothetical protein
MRGEKRLKAGRHVERLAGMEVAIGAQHADGMSDLRVVSEPPLERFHEVHQVRDSALAKPQPTTRHGQSLLKDMVAHHYFGAGRCLSVEMQGAGVGKELLPVIGESTPRFSAKLQALQRRQHGASDSLDKFNHGRPR